jgi:thymidylate synthase (FAD)
MSTLDELRGKKFDVLDDGFVVLMDTMGSDAAICQAARVSYGEGTKSVSDDRTLVRYLMRHRHSTPFEMAELKFHGACADGLLNRQWIRHRTANVNEYSTRYTEAIDSAQHTPPAEWRLQATTNKQGSSGRLEEWPAGWSCRETVRVTTATDGPYLTITSPNGVLGDNYPGCCNTPGGFLSWMETCSLDAQRQHYDIRLQLGVAREQARKDLPLSTYTEAYWKIDLHNLLHFLGLRMDNHAQLEIRQYATIIGEQIVKPLFPLVWEAFEDYRLGAMYLSRLDKMVLTRIGKFLSTAKPSQIDFPLSATVLDINNALFWPVAWVGQERCRERDECLAKLKALGFVE